MNRWKSLWLMVAVALVGTLAQQMQSQSKPQPSAASQHFAGEGQVQQITLPQITPQILPGPNLAVYQKNCLICHSARYVSMQPRFPKAVWQAEVKKMVDAYGAQIPEADQALIVEYLVAVRGSDAPPGTPAPAK